MQPTGHYQTYSIFFTDHVPGRGPLYWAIGGGGLHNTVHIFMLGVYEKVQFTLG